MLNFDDITLDTPEIIQKDLEANPSYFPKYRQALIDAVVQSCLHHDTKPLILSRDEIQRRFNLCNRAIVMMRNEMNTETKVNFTLKRCCDILPQRLIDALREGKRIEDVINQKDSGRGTYSRDSLEINKMKVDLRDKAFDLDTTNTESLGPNQIDPETKADMQELEQSVPELIGD